jgi:hypothetical protein
VILMRLECLKKSDGRRQQSIGYITRR